MNDSWLNATGVVFSCADVIFFQKCYVFVWGFFLVSYFYRERNKFLITREIMFFICKDGEVSE